MSDTQTFKKSNTSQGTVMQRLSFWKLAIAKCGCLCVLAACASITASLNGVTISEMSGTQITLAVVALISSVVGVILAFLSETMSKLSEKAEAERKAEVANPSP